MTTADPPATTIASSSAPSGGLPTSLVRVAPSGRWPGLRVGEVWHYRGLLTFLVWRELKVRYAQTVLGAAWAVLQPVLSTLVFTVIFGRFARLPSDNVPYAVFSLAGLVPWTYFVTAVTGASNSLVTNTSLVTKVYFPRLVIPAAPIVAALLDLGIAFLALLALLLYHGIAVSIAAGPVLALSILIAVITAAGVGCWLAALNIQYRDVKYMVPFVLQLWMFASPVVYPLSLIPSTYRTLYAINPLVGAVAGFRGALVGGGPSATELAVSFSAACVIGAAGAAYFRRTEHVFADVA
jgi:homopolymeric O-antigen transport system permease protein